MQHGIYGPFNKDVLRYIVFQKSEARIAQEMGDVISAACEQVIKTNHVVVHTGQPVTEMTAQKTCSAGNHCPHTLPTL